MPRPKGSLNRTTIERYQKERSIKLKVEQEVRRTVAAAHGSFEAEIAQRSVFRKLAIEELAEILPTIKNVAMHYQKMIDVPAGAEHFKAWMTLFVEACSKLAPYQSPKFASVMLAMQKPAHQIDLSRLSDEDVFAFERIVTQIAPAKRDDDGGSDEAG